MKPPSCAFPFLRRKYYSTQAVSQCLVDFTREIAQRQPSFRVSPSNIRILNEPTDFHGTLMHMIRNARQRIFISSLYVGSKETSLVDELGAALDRNPSLTLCMILDFNRSTRPGNPINTVQLLAPLVKQFPNQVQLSLFRSPHLRGILSKVVPPRFKEGWGTWHAKIYGADDDVLISGANLNNSYFTNRQDRYLLISSTPPLAQYCADFIEAASTVSYSVSSKSLDESEVGVSWPGDLHVHPHRIYQLPVFQHFQSVNRRSVVFDEEDRDNSVWLFPVIQAGQFGMFEEQECLRILVGCLSKVPDPTPHIHFTSGYFGLSEEYRELILQSPFARWQIMAASPKANGFYGSSGISGRIPEGYTYLEQRFMDAVTAASTANTKERWVELQEWERPGWTYHAKGIWVSSQADKLPILSIFGSTNFNSRSAHIDTELSFAMVAASTSSPEATQLRKDLFNELQNLTAHAVPWQGSERRVRPGTKFLVKMVGDML